MSKRTHAAIRSAYNNDPEFANRAKHLLTLFQDPISIYEFEVAYMSEFDTEISPLIHCDATQKGIVLSTIPGIQVISYIDENDILGRVLIIKVKLSLN